MMHESHWVISGGWNRDKIHHKPLKKLLMKMRWKDAVVLWVLRRILVWICAIPIQLFSWDGKSTNALLWNHICGLTDHYNMQYVPFHKTGLHSMILFFCFKYIHLIIIFFKKEKGITDDCKGLCAPYFLNGKRENYTTILQKHEIARRRWNVRTTQQFKNINI